MTQNPLLEISDLSLSTVGTDSHSIVSGINITLHAGKVTALVGESGSGKSMTAMSILGLLPSALHITQGQCFYKEQDLYALDEQALSKIRGSDISVVFQEPMTALNPLHIVEKQIGEMLDIHGDYTPQARYEKIISLLNEVGIPNPEQRIKSYPHELSGGQRQRIMIAMALANRPDILILDEPTTALDVTVQAQILALLRDIRHKNKTAMLLISHDLQMVAKTADYIYVMKDGKIVEHGTTERVLHFPEQDYTKFLIHSVPNNILEQPSDNAVTLLKTELLNVRYPIKSGFFRRITGYIHAVKDISLDLKAGETIGIVGESGSGKSTFASAILQLTPYDGVVKLSGTDLSSLSRQYLRSLRSEFQPVFQDPYAALSPRMTIKQILREGLDLHHPSMRETEKEKIMRDTLEETGMESETTLGRYPHEFSGGQRQRIAIARALVMRPKLLILDEPTSALDRTVQKQVLTLLVELQKKYGMSYIFISHDLSVIYAMAHRIIVMKDGIPVEMGNTKEIFHTPATTYTKGLLRAATEYEVG